MPIPRWPPYMHFFFVSIAKGQAIRLEPVSFLTATLGIAILIVWAEVKGQSKPSWSNQTLSNVAQYAIGRIEAVTQKFWRSKQTRLCQSTHCVAWNICMLVTEQVIFGITLQKNKYNFLKDKCNLLQLSWKISATSCNFLENKCNISSFYYNFLIALMIT